MNISLSHNNKTFSNKINLAIVSLTLTVLAGCASGPSKDISLIPKKTDQVSSEDGLFIQPVKWAKTKPGCKGECPALSVDSLIFPGVPKLTDLVDQILAHMTNLSEFEPPYNTINGYEAYFWENAAPRDQTMLSARTRYRNRYITAIELNSGMYLTGAAHGRTVTQFLNWDNHAQRIINLNDLLMPGTHNRFVEILELSHRKWLHGLPEARNDKSAWNRLWPFQFSDNIALTDQGVVVKYNSYEIAPYSSGQPELVIPYAQLHGVLKPMYLPS